MLFYIYIELFQMFDEAEFNAATFAGRAYGIAEFLRLTRYYLEKGECYYPNNLLKKYQLDK